MILFLALALIAPLVSHPVAEDVPRADLERIARAHDGFALDLYGALRETEGNLCLSPTSVYAALLMTHVGARGATADELARALHLPPADEGWDAPRAHAAFAALARGNELAVREAKVRIVNALWGQERHPFLPDTLAQLERRFGAGLRLVDYVGDTPGAAAAINQWVRRSTEGRIEKIVEVGDLGPQTRLVLTNAVYFKNPWLERFHEAGTKPAPFHLAGGEPVEVPTMHLNHGFRYAETDALQLVELPLREGRWALVVLLPRDVAGLPALERELTGQRIARLMESAEGADVDLALPRFEFERGFQLKEALSALGLAELFTPGADLDGFDGGAGDLYVDEVLHKTFVAADENGVEAAAATAAVLKGVAMEPERRPVTFRADHPFFFAIRHQGTGQLLFVGRVNDPRS